VPGKIVVTVDEFKLQLTMSTREINVHEIITMFLLFISLIMESIFVAYSHDNRQKKKNDQPNLPVTQLRLLAHH
jgi:hypothetical protein